MDMDGLPEVCEGDLGDDGRCTSCGVQILEPDPDESRMLRAVARAEVAMPKAGDLFIERWSRLGLNSKNTTYAN